MKRVLLVSILVSIAACTSGGSDDDASEVTASAASVPNTEPLATATSAPVTTADAVVVTTEVAEVSVPTSERPGAINGPATVDDAANTTDTADCDRVPRGVTEFAIDAGGALHDVRVFVPEDLVGEPSPLVMNWHGLGSNGPEQAAYSGYEELAEREGFIVVHPTGVPALGGTQNSWELSAFDIPDRDDLAFADALIDEMILDWCVDPSRIYSTGMSNGGFFTAELVCNRADRLAAAASVAGITHPEECEPSRPVPYIAFHGTEDVVVPFDGSIESVLATEESGGFFEQVMPAEFAEFAADAGCDPEPVRTELTPEVIRFDYLGCVDDTPMSFFELPGSGHTWPGSPLADVVGETFGFHTVDIDAADDAWAFFSQHSL